MADDPGDLWQTASYEFGQPAMFSVAGPAGALAISPLAGPGGAFFAHSFTILAVAATIAGLFWLGGRAEVREFASRRPEVLGAIAGLAWWLWLVPSSMGLAIVALSIAIGAQRTRRRRRLGPPSSQIRSRLGNSAQTATTESKRIGRAE